MRITVFTPTYNRAYILENLYRSLQRQSFHDFEWLIVDDGSTDNTEELVATWHSKDNLFPIRYYKKENGGKCSAINYALDLAAGLLFLTIDSDDYITDDALQKVSDWEASIQDLHGFCGVSGNLGTSPNDTPNQLFHENYQDATLLDRYHNIDGERAFAFYTEIHKKYRYPIFDNEKFMTEAVVWNRMAHDGYRMRFYNDIICIYKYKDDGLTKAGNSIFINNPRGYGLCLKEKEEFLNHSMRSRFRLYYTFTCELSDRYDRRLIAESIETSPCIIRVCQFIHKIISKIRG